VAQPGCPALHATAFRVRRHREHRFAPAGEKRD